MQRAATVAQEYGSGQVQAVHLLVAMLLTEHGVGYRALSACGLDVLTLQEWLHQHVPAEAGHQGAPTVGSEVRQLLTMAESIALQMNHRQVGTEHLLLAALDLAGSATPADALTACGVHPDDARDRVYQVMGELGMLS